MMHKCDYASKVEEPQIAEGVRPARPSRRRPSAANRTTTIAARSHNRPLARRRTRHPGLTATRAAPQGRPRPGRVRGRIHPAWPHTRSPAFGPPSSPRAGYGPMCAGDGPGSRRTRFRAHLRAAGPKLAGPASIPPILSSRGFRAVFGAVSRRTARGDGNANEPGAVVPRFSPGPARVVAIVRGNRCRTTRFWRKPHKMDTEDLYRYTGQNPPSVWLRLTPGRPPDGTPQLLR